MTFGEKVRELRKEKGMTQIELANELEISIRAVRGWELENRLPRTADIYVKLAELFGCSLDYLMTDSDAFVTNATQRYGVKGGKQAQELLEEVQGLFSGGNLADEDMDEMMKAIQDAYWIAKEKNRKYTRKEFQQN